MFPYPLDPGFQTYSHNSNRTKNSGSLLRSRIQSKWAQSAHSALVVDIVWNPLPVQIFIFCDSCFDLHQSLQGGSFFELYLVASDLLEHRNTDEAARILFLLGAAIMATVAVYVVWKPRSVFDNVRAEYETAAHPLKDFKRLVRHWPIYPALLIWLLWNFAPGSATPLQYYLQAPGTGPNDQVQVSGGGNSTHEADWHSCDQGCGH